MSPSGAALLANGDGAARRWHEANDTAGLSALLGGRRPVRLSDDVAEALAGSVDPDGEMPVTAPLDAARRDARPESARSMTDGEIDEALAKARAEGEAVAREAFAAGFAALARSVARERETALDALECELVALARSIAACAMRRELRSDPGALIEHVRDALDALATALGSTAPVTVRLHPEDAAAIGEALGADVLIVADASLARTDCRLERGAARLDASVCARLDALGLERDLIDSPVDMPVDADADGEAEEAVVARSDDAVGGSRP